MDEQRGERRLKALPDLPETIPAGSLEQFKNRFEEAVGDRVKARKSAKAISFNEAGQQVVGKSIEEFCALSNHIYEPLMDAPLHELRIAAKRLRYAVELYTACWGDEPIAPFAGQIAVMQNYLGEVHDADLWLESLSKNLKKTKTKIRQTSGFYPNSLKNGRKIIAPRSNCGEPGKKPILSKT